MSDRQAGASPEVVTPQMVEAGVTAFAMAFGGGRLVLQDAVTKVYSAMRSAAALKPTDAVSP